MTPSGTILRSIPPGFDGALVAEIDARLDQIEREHAARIPLAIESGSRAWGFPSPDSDYDCRFVYVRRAADYLTLFPKRDVIETPLTPVLDVSGWDVAKALKLMLNGNAVIIEWLTSPIVYRANQAFAQAFLDLAGVATDRNRLAHHYLRLGQSIVREKLGDLDDVALKKLFYALRPAMALRWMRLHPAARIAPMNFQTLCAGAALPSDLSRIVHDLLARKAVTREMGRGPVPEIVRTTIFAEFETAETHFTRAAPASPEDHARADAFFRRCVAEFAAD